MAAPSDWNLYADFLINSGIALIDLDSHVFKIALFQAGSTAGNSAATPATYLAFANEGLEVAPGMGYTPGGVVAGTGVLTGGGASATTLFEVSGEPSWTAGDRFIAARIAVLYDDTTAQKWAVAWLLLDSDDVDVTISPGDSLTIVTGNVFTAGKA